MAESDGLSEIRVPGSFELRYQRDYAAVVGLVYGMTGSQWVAEDLAQEAFCALTGTGLASAIVAWVDRTRLNRHDAARLMQAEVRLASTHEAGKLATMAEVAFSPPGDADSPVERSPKRSSMRPVKSAAALTSTRRAAENDLDDALTMTGRLRRVWERFAAGDCGPQKMREYVRHLVTSTLT